MMNNNKILTVSYGTFSCTLEGFDDSFDTMKAIAEYFRDLASDDRYFGAEPPQPDAEMLARIAEREVSRRVEAREHDGRIMLKAHEDAAEASPVEQVAAAATVAAATAYAAVPEAEEVEEEPTQAFSAPYTDTPVEPTAYAVPAYEAPAAPFVEAADPATGDATSVDAPADAALDSIEPEALPEEVAEEVTAENADAEDVAFDIPETHHAPDPELESAAAFFAGSVVEDAPEPEMEETISVEAFTGYISPGDQAEAVADDDRPLDVSDSFEADDEPTDDFSVDDASDVEAAEVHEEILEAEELILDESDAPAPSFTTESFADKLARIRAVVSKQDDEEASGVYEDDEDDADQSTDFAPMDSDLDATFVSAPEAAEETLEDATGDIEDALAADEVEIEPATAQDMAAEEEDELDSILADFDATEENDPAESTADDLVDDLSDFDLSADAEGEASDDDNLFGQDVEEEAHEEDAPLVHSDDVADEDSTQGRVLKVNSADLQAALETGELEEFVDDSLSDAAALSDEQEDDLQQELADLEGDEPEDTAKNAAAREILPEIGENSDEDVSRLMAEADQQMEEPEGQTRRSAFAHLRAAVAARFADKSMDKEALEAEEQAEVYRSDLAEVVKPRRPDTPDEKSQRPADLRAAPLKLVAEQRIDTDDASGVGNPVAPRRVAAPMELDEDQSEDTGFADYAEERGASSLPELLEAAASYLCFVEGFEEFSRPQLMTRVRQADCGAFTREDGLRSFGQLLRTGKIEKIKGGRFIASEAIGYKPDHRAAG